MTFQRNGDSAPRTRGPRRFQQNGTKTEGGHQHMAGTAYASTSEGMHRAVAPLSSGLNHRRGGARTGHRRGGASKQSATKNGNVNKHGNAVGSQASEASCAWPAYARSVAEATAEVLDAVSSLYADELKPVGRILRKRVAERILESGGILASTVTLDALPEVDTKQVRAVCEACDQLRMEEEDGGDWSAVFVDRSPHFVDVYNPDDCYPEELWLGLRAYCESPAGQEMSLPGGRYASAQALMALQLSVLAGLSLGRICHVVQLAISQKRILGYMNGAVVPYARSQAMVKEQCAIYGQPCVGSVNNAASSLPIASLDAARKYVKEILDAGNGEVPLSNVKRIFRSRYQLDLSETSFGHSKLSELLQDVTFQDICTVELQGHGYTVIDVRNKHECMADSLVTATPPSTAALLEDGPCRVPLCPDEPLFDDLDVLTDAVPIVFGPTPTPTATGQSEIIPRRVVLCPDEPLSVDDMGSLMEGSPMVFAPTPTPTTTGLAGPHWGPNTLKDSVDGFVASSVQQAFLQYKMPQTPLLGSQQQSHSLPRHMDVKLLEESESSTDASTSGSVRRMSHMRSGSNSSSEGSSTEALFGIVSQLPTEIASLGCAVDGEGLCESARPRVNFCPDEPLGFEDADILCGRSPGTTPLHSLGVQTPDAAPIAAQAKWQPWTPGTLSKEGCVVHNTFLHIAPSLPTPIRTGAARRTSSVPKDVGRSLDREPDEQWEPDEHRSLNQDNCECIRSTCCTSPLLSPLPALSPAHMPPCPGLMSGLVHPPYGAERWQCPLPPPPLPPSFAGQLPPLPLPPQFAPAASPISSELQFARMFATPPVTQPGSLCSYALQAPLQGTHPGLVIRLGEYL